jgi:two-component system NarL family response regulator
VSARTLDPPTTREEAHNSDNGEQPELTRTLLVDDHDVVRKGLRLLLETHFELSVVEASNAVDAVAWAKDETVQLVFMDVRLGERDGLWALEQIRKDRPDLPVVMLSTYDADEYVQAAMDGGARGYVLKEATTHQLREAIKTALRGVGVYLHPSVAQRVLHRQTAASRYEELSRREIQVLQLVAVGQTNEDIAGELFITEKTVKSHLSSIFRKLGVSNRTQAAMKAIKEGVVRSE